MSSWILAPCLVMLRSEFNQLAPSRDKASDGSIGDIAHSARASDHNPDPRGVVHAIDVDHSGPWPAELTMERLVQQVVLRHRAGLDDRLQNVIYMRRIWSRSWGWTARAYAGVNPHDHHAHFSCRYDAAVEASTRPWGLLQLLEEDDVTKVEFAAWMTEWAKSPAGAEALARAVLNTDGIIPAPEGSRNSDGSVNTHWGAWSFLRWGYEAAVSARTYSAAASAGVARLAGQDDVDEQAIVAGVLAGLNPQVIAQAIPAELAGQVADELATRLAR